MAKIIYKEVEVRLHDKANGKLTVEDAKLLLGWEEDEGDKFSSTGYHLKLGKRKIRFNNNPSNRPFRLNLAKRYAKEILRGKWKLNGESIVLDRYGHVQSGQHRLAALVLAEEERKKKVDHWKAYGVKGPVAIEALLVLGISEKPDTVDTLDLGQKRSLGDVIFRNKDFGGDKKDQRALSSIMAGATRLAWIRCGGRVVSDAPHFPHSEALDFIEAHPGLHEAVEFIHTEEGGTGVEGKRISAGAGITLAYAAALCYLQSASRTDPLKFQETGEVDLSLKDKAQEFWTLLASGAGLEKGHPILVLRNYLPKVEASSSQGRDEIVASVVKAWNIWVDDPKATVTLKDVRPKKTNDDEGRKVLAEEPRMGGLDTVREEPEVDEDEELAEATEVEQKGSKSKGGWAVGDRAWVNDEDGAHWFGEITEELDTDQGKMFLVQDLGEEGESWEVKAKDLRVKEPVAA